MFVFFLVFLAAIFAGLTIGIISLDSSNLEILSKSGSDEQKKYASTILPIRKKGHLLLCTLLIANTLVNEALPILLGPLVGGGWKAISFSSILIVIFGEIIPQAICTKHGLYISAKFSRLINTLIVILYPISYPISLLLDRFIGHSSDVSYQRPQFINTHKASFIPEEAKIINSAFDFQEKNVFDAMTKINEVFMLSYDDVIDKRMIHKILQKGYSKIPIFYNEKNNIIGLIHVKSLLNARHYIQINKLNLIKIPVVDQSTLLIDVLSLFKFEKNHFAIVNNSINHKNIGIITLEDVFEELIGEKFFDEKNSNYFDHLKKQQSSLYRKNGGLFSHYSTNTSSTLLDSDYLPSYNKLNTIKKGFKSTFPLNSEIKTISIHTSHIDTSASSIFKPISNFKDSLILKNKSICKSSLLATHKQYDTFKGCHSHSYNEEFDFIKNQHILPNEYSRSISPNIAIQSTY